MVRRLWVIEQRYDRIKERWFPVASEFTRDAARELVNDYYQNNPGDEFRVREYRPYGDVGEG
jgi:hypothetical protein